MRARADVDGLTYVVHCHVCPGGYSAEQAGLPRTTDQHPRYVSRMLGSTQYGGLWHCPEHNDTPVTNGVHSCGCPHGDWTDELPTDEQLARYEAWRAAR